MPTAPAAPATLFLNGTFHTLEPGVPPAALLAREGRIEALGEAAAAASAGAQVVDLDGGTAIPGPVDAHCHLVSYGLMRRREADLRGTRTVDEILERLRRHAGDLGLRPGDGRWLLGRGFDQEQLPGGTWPSQEALDGAAPGIPLRITRVCGHALVANRAAMHAAGMDPDTAEPGFPAGVVTEARMAAIHSAVPEPTAAEWRQAAEWACHEAARAGFVGVHSLMAHEREMRALADLHAAGALPVRVVMQPPYSMLAHLDGAGLRTGFGDDFLSLGAVKLFSDGSLGARTAALREPYADAPDTSGELIYPPEELARRVAAVYRAGFQVCVHAIGDRAMEVTLDACASAAAECAPVLPPRIEHASLVDPGLVARMAALQVGAAIQPQFAWSDSWAPERLGPGRAHGCYAFRTLHAAGIPLAGSTDCPVESLDAMAALGQLVHRPAWSPREGLPLLDALRVFSEGSYALRGFPAGAGRLSPGQPADFVVLERDPFTVSPEELPALRIRITVVAGNPVAWPAR